jgi:hypothetical protein
MIDEESNATNQLLHVFKVARSRRFRWYAYSGVTPGTIRSSDAYDCTGFWGTCCAAACSLPMLEASGLADSKALGS